jgi:cardiolipin synthase
LVGEIDFAMSQFWKRLLVTRQLVQLRLQDAHKTWQTAESVQPMVWPVRPRLSGATESVGARAALVLRDNVRNRSRIERVYRKAIADARNEIVIANAYFLPGAKLRRALVHAVHRGVRVRLLLHGTYESFMQYHAVRPVLKGLLDAGVEIHEYSPGFLHAKVAVVDGRWATVGSSNLDPLSLLLAREANVVVEDSRFAQALRACILTAMQNQGVKLNVELFSVRPWQYRILDQLAYGLTRLILLLAGRRY